MPLILHPVRNITGQDLTPPVVVEASIDKDNIKLTFNEELDAVHLPPVIITEAQLTLTLAQTLKARDALTLSYTPGENPVQDLEGNLAPAQNDYPVQNQTEGDITPPILEETEEEQRAFSCRKYCI